MDIRQPAVVVRNATGATRRIFGVTRPDGESNKMSLLSGELTVWEIAHRWAGYDPATFRVRLPLPVRDNCRILIDAIFNAEIDSLTLHVEKWNPADGEEMRKYDIRYYLEEVHACIDGRRFSRPMLRQASIARHEMRQWCELHSIPLPEFWFPAGWGHAYDWKVRDSDLEVAVTEQTTHGDAQAIRPSTATKVACQQIAQAIWKEEPSMTIADMVKHHVIQRYGGAAVYTPATVREWLSAVAPFEVKNKRGRPRKKMGGDDSLGAPTSDP